MLFGFSKSHYLLVTYRLVPSSICHLYHKEIILKSRILYSYSSNFFKYETNLSMYQLSINKILLSCHHRQLILRPVGPIRRHSIDAKFFKKIDEVNS